MDLPHHFALLAGYAIAMVGWLATRHALPKVWPKQDTIPFSHPWREFGYAVLAMMGVIAIGQLYQRGWLLPATGRWGLILDSMNQILVFMPVIALLALRGHSLASAWIRTERVVTRVAVGLALALCALFGFALVRSSVDAWPALVYSVYDPKNVRYAIHVFLEDMAIAVLFVRLAAAIRYPFVVVIAVAALFAAGHIPGDLAEGARLIDLAPLILDFALGILVLVVVYRSADIWWFWCVHFAMDMTQFSPSAAQSAMHP